jgi:HAD superfamily hydrolase (TIGR01549 family)
MARALIVDLDNTLIDSEPLADLRKGRDWSACRRNAHRTTCFPEIQEVIAHVRAAGIPVGVVTRSPSQYAAHLLSHHGIGYDALVAYHDVRRQKPDPESVMLCLSKLRASPSVSLGIGDDPGDAEAYRSAGMLAWGAGWSPHLVDSGSWDLIAAAPSEILVFMGLR